MSIKLERHFYYVKPLFIARKLFLCRCCEHTCIPYKFQPFNVSANNVVTSIAISYFCPSCKKEFITSPSLSDS